MYHKVKDFATWKKAFDGFHDFRKSSGELSFSVGTLQGNPNTAYVVNTWDSMEKLDAFVNSTDLKDAMMSSGVLEAPQTLIFNEVERG